MRNVGFLDKCGSYITSLKSEFLSWNTKSPKPSSARVPCPNTCANIQRATRNRENSPFICFRGIAVFRRVSPESPRSSTSCLRWPIARHRCLLHRAREIFGRPVSFYLPRTGDLDICRSPTECHGGIKHCLPIEAARTRGRVPNRDIQYRSPSLFMHLLPPCFRLSCALSFLMRSVNCFNAIDQSNCTKRT